LGLLWHYLCFSCESFMGIRVHKGFSYWFFMFCLGFVMSNRICIGNIGHGGCVKDMILLLCVYVASFLVLIYLSCHDVPLIMFWGLSSSSLGWLKHRLSMDSIIVYTLEWIYYIYIKGFLKNVGNRECGRHSNRTWLWFFIISETAHHSNCIWLRFFIISKTATVI
jgi:hypothetical protein